MLVKTKLPVYYSISCIDGSLELNIPGEFIVRAFTEKDSKLTLYLETDAKPLEEASMHLISNSRQLRYALGMGMVCKGSISKYHLKKFRQLRLSNPEKFRKKVYGYSLPIFSCILAEQCLTLKEFNEYSLDPKNKKNRKE